MTIYFLDTNILIDLVGAKKSAVFFKDRLGFETRLATSIISITEFLVKASKSEEAFINRLIEAQELEVHFLDDLDLARLAAKLRRDKGIKLPDALILAMASRLKAQLLTSDKDLFKKASGLLTAIDPTT